ncbi:MAG: hypothetical protein CVU06_14705, partial [Bacteroidetes bacterium HGW-Bacteroidetes-22]
SNAAWTALCDQGWCTVTPSGTGNGSINAVFTENTSFSPRIAYVTLTVAGLVPSVVSVTQAGTSPSLSVTPANQDVTASAGNTDFSVLSNTSWLAVSDQPSWCSVTPSGSGDGTITATYSENTSTSSRTATITVSASGVAPVYVTLIQSGQEIPEFFIHLENIQQTAPNTMEFDIFILDNNPSDPLDFASCQFGINFNTAFLNGATQTAGMTTIIAGSSDFPPALTPISVNSATSGLIKIAGRAPTGSGSFIISSVAPGSRVARFRLTNSLPFAENSTPDMAFTSSSATSPSYATRMAIYINGVNTLQTITPGLNALVLENPLLNGPPTLDVSPSVQNVTYDAGSVDFVVTSNAEWSATSDQPWCSANTSGFGNGIITAAYTENTFAARSANISVSVSGLPVVTVTVNQDATLVKTLNLNALLEGLYQNNGIMNEAHDENGLHFGYGIADEITVELHNAAEYSLIEFSAANINLGTNGNAVVSIPPVLNGNYYITIKHRNSIE